MNLDCFKEFTMSFMEVEELNLQIEKELQTIVLLYEINLLLIYPYISITYKTH